MGSRLVNQINARRYRDRSKIFANFQIGDLVKISPNGYLNSIKGRPVARNEKNKFRYVDRKKRLARGRYSITKWEIFRSGTVGLYLGRYDGGAVLLIGEGLYKIGIDYIKKVNEDGNVS